MSTGKPILNAIPAILFKKLLVRNWSVIASILFALFLKKPKVFITRRLPKKIETRMMELFDTTLNEKDTLLNEEQLIDVFKNYEIIVPSIADDISKKVIIIIVAV